MFNALKSVQGQGGFSVALAAPLLLITGGLGWWIYRRRRVPA
jgi:hypothetical protein